MLVPQGLLALGNQACQARRDKEDLQVFQVAQVPKGNKAQQVVPGNQVCQGPLEIWDPKAQKVFQAIMGPQVLKVRQGLLGLPDTLGSRGREVLLA